MADIAVSSQTATELSKEEYDKAKNIYKTRFQSVTLKMKWTFTWKYCRQKLDADISVKVLAAKDKKR